MIIAFDNELDVCGLDCPLPILKTKKALANMTSGQILRVITTDKESIHDFQIFSKHTGNNLVSYIQKKNLNVFYIQRR